MTANAMQFFPTVDSQAIDAVLAGWQSAYPHMGVLALLPETEQEAVPVLQQACKARGVPLVGALFPAIIADASFHSNGVWLLRFNTMPYVALHADLPCDGTALTQAVETIVAGIRPNIGNSGREITLFMLFDAMVPNIGTLLDELYLTLANRYNAGVCADSREMDTYRFGLAKAHSLGCR